MLCQWHKRLLLRYPYPSRIAVSVSNGPVEGSCLIFAGVSAQRLYFKLLSVRSVIKSGEPILLVEDGCELRKA